MQSPAENIEPFPPLESATEDGLLAVGGDLSAKRLVLAYRSGIFPWFNPGDPILWWSPDPRCVLIPSEFRASRSLAKSIRTRGYQVTRDTAFARVIELCAASRTNQPGTWITDEMKTAYQNLHRLGIAHSVETWLDDELVGGLYGIALGSVFFGESMFSRKNDASKVAFAKLVDWLLEWRFSLVDCQVSSSHLMSLGAREIPRTKFLDSLKSGISENADSNWGKAYQGQCDLQRQ